MRVILFQSLKLYKGKRIIHSINCVYIFKRANNIFTLVFYNVK